MVHIYERSGVGDGDVSSRLSFVSPIGTVIFNLTFWVSVKKEVTRIKSKQYLVPLTKYALFICGRISAAGAFTCRRFDGMDEPCLYISFYHRYKRILTICKCSHSTAWWCRSVKTPSTRHFRSWSLHCNKSDNLLCCCIGTAQSCRLQNSLVVRCA